MSEPKTILTSVKVDSNLWEEFRIECVRRKFSFNKLANRAIFLYLNNEEFRKLVTNAKLDAFEE